MKIMRMRTDHVALYVIHLIAVFATGLSDNPLTGGNNLEYDCSQQELSLNLSQSVINTLGENFVCSPLIVCLNLQGNQINSVKNGAFDGVPALEYLNMAGNMIDDVLSFGDHENLRTLILANQSVYYDREINIFGKYPQLRYLDLSGNKINSINWAMERNVQNWGLNERIDLFPELQVLDLSHNSIGSLFRNEYLIPAMNLTHLFLHRNNLNYVNLKYFTNLIVLTVDNNNIQALRRNYCQSYSMCVSDMPRLKYLSISNNQLQFINYDFFAFMPELAMLNLSNNQLSSNIYGVFDSLISLKDLNIDNNLLSEISLFKQPVQLFNLSLNHNNINYINSKDFINVPNLRKLYLNNNKIINIHEKAFWSLDLLEELHLANNDLTTLPEEWSNNLRSLRYLDLASNNFMYLESLSLSDTLPLIKIDLISNPIISFSAKMLYDIPENATIHLIHDQRNKALDTSA